MAEALEGRQRRNGPMRRRTGHVRDDISALQKDLGKLSSDLGDLAGAQWNDLRERMDEGVGYVSDQVRTHPVTAVGLAAGAGLLAGLALGAMTNGGERRRHH